MPIRQEHLNGTCDGTLLKAHIVVLCVLAVIGCGCDRFLGDRIEVSFRNVEGLNSGDAVYLAGVRIGTTGTPLARDGRAIIPVYVRNLKMLPAKGAVFFLTNDLNRQGSKRLVVISLGSDPSVITRERAYNGASTELELAALVGSAKARQILSDLFKLIFSQLP